MLVIVIIMLVAVIVLCKYERDKDRWEDYIISQKPLPIDPDYARLECMSDEEIKQVWEAIWCLDPEQRPDMQWIEDVYTVMSNRGISAV